VELFQEVRYLYLVLEGLRLWELHSAVYLGANDYYICHIPVKPHGRQEYLVDACIEWLTLGLSEVGEMQGIS